MTVEERAVLNTKYEKVLCYTGGRHKLSVSDEHIASAITGRWAV